MLGFVSAAALVVSLVTAQGSEDAHAKCEKLRQQDPTSYKGYVCYYVHARKTGLYADTIVRVQEIALAEPERTWARYILADLLSDQGEPQATELYRLVSEEFKAAKDYRSATLSRLAHASGADAESLEDTLAQIEWARETAVLSEDPTILAQVDVQQARILSNHGTQFALAGNLLERARPIAFPNGPYELRKHILFVEATLAEGLDDPELGLELNLQLADMAALAGDTYVEALARETALDIQTQYPALRGTKTLDELARASAMVGELAVASGNPYAEARYTCTAADLAEHRDQAVVGYQRCLELAKELSYPGAHRSALFGLALAAQEPEVGLAHMREAEALARAQGQSGASNLLFRARMAFVAGDRSGALTAATALFDRIDLLLARQGDVATRARTLAGFNPHYYEIAQRLLGAELDGGADDIGAALIIVERMRARTIATSLAEAHVTPNAPAQPRLQAVDREITSINRRLRVADLEDTEREELLGVLDGLESEEGALRDRATDAPDYAPIISPPIPTLAEVQASLREDQALFSFQLAREPFATRWEDLHARSWLAVITRSDVKLYPLPDRSVVEPLVDLFSGLFVEDEAVAADMAVGLHRMLVAEAIAGLDPAVSRLVLVPDGALHRLPFAALADTDGEVISQRFEVSVAPSIAVWEHLRRVSADRARVAMPTAALALVDPTVGSHAAAMRSSGTGPSLDLGRLPFAHREAASLGGIAETLVLSGPDANEAFLSRQDLSQYGIVHFAAHAVVDELHPERASIVLAPGSDDYDGLLQQRELFSARFDGALVVLAACQSATGKIVGADGPLGLGQALFGGGARTVVATLWRIRDDDAAEFFDVFYRELGTGISVGSAVAAAQRELNERGMPASAWAGIVVLGDGDYVPLPKPQRWWPYVGALLALLAILGAVIWSRRRATRGRA